MLSVLYYFVHLVHFYGGHSADLLFHIIISELQCIILDSSPKKISWREKYYLGAKNIIGRVYLLGRVYLFCPLMQCSLTFRHLRLGHPLVNITHRLPPLNPCRSTSANLEGIAQLNMRVSRSTLLRRHPPKPTYTICRYRWWSARLLILLRQMPGRQPLLPRSTPCPASCPTSSSTYRSKGS